MNRAIERERSLYWRAVANRFQRENAALREALESILDYNIPLPENWNGDYVTQYRDDVTKALAVLKRKEAKP